MAGAEITVFEDGGVRVVKIGPMGPYGNNAYVVRDVAAGVALLVDMPLDEEPLLAAPPPGRRSWSGALRSRFQRNGSTAASKTGRRSRSAAHGSA